MLLFFCLGYLVVGCCHYFLKPLLGSILHGDFAKYQNSLINKGMLWQHKPPPGALLCHPQTRPRHHCRSWARGRSWSLAVQLWCRSPEGSLLSACYECASLGSELGHWRSQSSHTLGPPRRLNKEPVEGVKTLSFHRSIMKESYYTPSVHLRVSLSYKCTPFIS